MRAIPKLPTVAFVKTNLLPQESQHDVSYIVFALYFIHRVVIQPFFFWVYRLQKREFYNGLHPNHPTRSLRKKLGQLIGSFLWSIYILS